MKICIFGIADNIGYWKSDFTLKEKIVTGAKLPLSAQCTLL